MASPRIRMWKNKHQGDSCAHLRIHQLARIRTDRCQQLLTDARGRALVSVTMAPVWHHLGMTSAAIDSAVQSPEPDALELQSASDTINEQVASTEAPVTQAEREPMLNLDGLRQVMQRLGGLKPESFQQWLPALRILGLAVAAGVGLKLTGAVLSAINELPLLGRLLELVGLVSAIQFISRNALRRQRRAELLARIEALKADLIG